MTPQRRQKFWNVLQKRQSNLTVVLEDVMDAHNIAAVLRTCDAIGVGEIYLIHSPELKYCKLGKHQRGKKSSATALKWIDFHQFEDTATCLAAVRQKYDKIYTTHLSNDATELYDMNLTQSVALMFGNEREGLSETALAHSDGNFTIPQVGMIPSLNISVACAVTLYEACRQRKQAGLYAAPNLSQQEQQALFDAWKLRDEEK